MTLIFPGVGDDLLHLRRDPLLEHGVERLELALFPWRSRLVCSSSPVTAPMKCPSLDTTLTWVFDSGSRLTAGASSLDTAEERMTGGPSRSPTATIFEFSRCILRARPKNSP
ncbi:MAG: hypothetical protein ACKO3N_09890 [Verrucomicrobiota bacterium]